MKISLDLNWVASVLLASLRVGTVFVLTPLMTMGATPRHFRVLFVLGLTAALIAGLAVPVTRIDWTLGGLLVAAAGELILGALLAFGLIAGFAVFQLAGRILDLQMGFGIAALIDPTTKSQTPLLGTLLYMAAVIAFFAVDGHHLVIRGLAYSLSSLPPGSGLVTINLAPVMTQFGAMFLFAVAIATPVVLVLFLVDVALAIMARVMPQMNVFFISLSLKIAVGLLTLILAFGFLSPVVKRVFETIFEYFEQTLGAST
jgi:flagellar biosynthesis protein FliR